MCRPGVPLESGDSRWRTTLYGCLWRSYVRIDEQHRSLSQPLSHDNCMKCGSRDLRYAGGLPETAGGFSTISFFRCEICGWVAAEEILIGLAHRLEALADPALEFRLRFPGAFGLLVLPAPLVHLRLDCIIVGQEFLVFLFDCGSGGISTCSGIRPNACSLPRRTRSPRPSAEPAPSATLRLR